MTLRQIGLVIAAMGVMAALALPLGGGASLFDHPIVLATMAAAAGAIAMALRHGGIVSIAPLMLASASLAAVTIVLLDAPGVAGHAAAGFWNIVVAAWISAIAAVAGLSALTPRALATRRLVGLAVPLLFGAFLFYLWEVAVRGFGVPAVLMPAPSAIFARFIVSLPTLAADFVQTFVRGVLSGYLTGCAAGFLAAIVADRIPFLQRGLLPVGNFVSALPVVGIAPIMVMWFGFDWQSKAAVVVVMTFFPMLVNTVSGLSVAGGAERDLMRSYGADYRQTLLKLRLPAAMPFVFNALKINSTLALIGAIVAEFFGTPVVGMGFRISIEVARMSLDMVWAEIALAALAGTAFYGVVALAERAATFWHPSYRT
jgi:NitT/TauT family transport system permease protein